jgi:hypothetical protein
MSLRDVLESTNRGVRITERGARSNIQDEENKGEM